MNYLEEKNSVIYHHSLLLKNFKVRKNLNDIAHINLYKEWKSFIEAIIFEKNIIIQNSCYNIITFFNITKEQHHQIKTINLKFIEKILNQESYKKSIEFIQNNTDNIKIIERDINNIFSNIFRKLM